MHVSRGFFLFLGLLLSASFSFAAPAKFTYQGQIIKPNGQPLEDSNVAFRIEIVSPGPEACILYEETHTLNMSASNGIFSVTVGEGARPGDGSFEDLTTLRDALDNSTGLVSPTDCTGGPNYTPAIDDGRKLRVTFNDGSGPVTLTQDHNVVSVPFASSAHSVSGLTATDLLTIRDDASFQLNQANLETVFSNANWAELQALLDGSSSSFVQPAPTGDVDNNNQKIVNLADPDPNEGKDAVNVDYANSYIGGQAVDTADLSTLAVGNADEVLTWNGTQWTSTSIPEDTTKLNKAGDTMSGTLNMGNNDITNINNLSVNSTISVTGGIGVGTGINSGGTINLQNENALQFSENSGNGTNFVSLKAPNALASDLSWTLPSTQGTPGQMLQAGTGGTLSWADPSAIGYLQDGGNSTGASIRVGTNDSQSLELETNNTARMTLDSTGDVGIGTTNPWERLTVVGGGISVQDTINGGTATALSLNNPHAGFGGPRVGMDFSLGTGSVTYSRISSGAEASNRGSLRFFTRGTTPSIGIYERMTINEDGNVGIGTSDPSERLEVNGTIRSQDLVVQGTTGSAHSVYISNASNGIYLGVDGYENGTINVERSNSDLRFQIAGSDQMRILDSGNVGIGTSNPSTKLEVNGTLTASAYVGNGSGLTNVTSTSSTSSTNTSNYIINSDSDNTGADGGVSFQTNGSTVASVSASGQLNGNSGSVGSVGIGFQGDSDTGLYSPIVDTVSLSAGGIEGLRINNTPSGVNYVELYPGATGAGPTIASAGSDTNIDINFTPKGSGHSIFTSGRVGLGVSNPSERLDVQGNINLSGRIFGGETDSYLDIHGGGGRIIGNNRTVISGSKGSQLNISVGDELEAGSGRIRMKLDTGFRDDTPDATVEISADGSTTGSAFMVSSDDNNDGDLVNILKNGDVGIGTSSPSSKFEVVGTVTASAFSGDGSGLTNIVSTSSSSSTNTGNYVINSDSDNAGADGGVSFQTNGSTVASISPSGQFNANAGSVGSVGVGFQGDSDTGLFSQSSNTLSLSAGGVEGLRINNTPSGVNYVELSPGATGNGPTIGAQGADTNIDLNLTPKGAGNSIFTSGNVGIGTTNPSSALHVDGKITTTSLMRGPGMESPGSPSQSRAYFSNTHQFRVNLANTTMFFARSDSSRQVEIAPDSAVDDVYIGVPSNPEFHLDLNNRRVGINKLNPVADLDVSGDALVSGSLGIGTTAPQVALDVNTGSINAAEICDESNSACFDLSTGLGDFKSDGSVSMTGPILASPGTTASPSISFAGDTDTGFKNEWSNNSITMVSGGTGKINVFSNFMTQFGGNTANWALKTTPGSHNAATPPYTFWGGGSNEGMYSPAADSLGFVTEGAEALRIDGSGNIGIGTTSPSAKLAVESSGSLGNWGGFNLSNATFRTYDGANSIYMDGNSLISNNQLLLGTTTAQEIQFGTNNSEKMRITSAGNVGIGTATPTNLLHLSNYAGAAGEEFTPGIFIQDPTNTVNYGGSLYYEDRSGANGLKISTTDAGTETGFVFIDRNSGNVGIGTTNPQTELDVVGDGPVRGNFEGYGTNPSHSGIISLKKGRGTSSAPLAIQNNDDLGGLHFNGYDGTAATTASAKIIGRATEDFTSSARGAELVFETSSNGSVLPTQQMVISSNGDVGIGTATPSYKLHVNGSVAGVGAYNNLSDRRLKRNIASLENPIEDLLKVQGVRYDWARSEYPEYDFPEGKDMGVIAQDVKEVFPEAVVESKDGILSVAYSKLIAPIIESIRTLFERSKVHEQKLLEKDQEIQSLKEKNSELEKRLERIEKLLINEDK